MYQLQKCKILEFQNRKTYKIAKLVKTAKRATCKI